MRKPQHHLAICCTKAVGFISADGSDKQYQVTLCNMMQLAPNNIMCRPHSSTASVETRGKQVAACPIQAVLFGYAGGKYSHTARADTGKNRPSAAHATENDLQESSVTEMSGHHTPSSQGSQAASSREDPS